MPVRSKTIDLDEFVDLDEIDPIFYDSAYYLAPDKATEALRTADAGDGGVGKVGIGRFVMRIEAVRRRDPPHRRTPVLSTMVYRGRDRRSGVDLRDRGQRARSRSPSARSTWPSRSSSRSRPTSSPRKYQDEYREQVLGLIERKAAGEEAIEAPAPAAVDAEGGRPHRRARGERQARPRPPRSRHPAASSDDGDRCRARSGEGRDGCQEGDARPRRPRREPAEKAPAARKRKSA